MEKETKHKLTFECNVSGIQRKVDILISNPEGNDFMVAVLESVIKQIQDTLSLKTPRGKNITVHFQEPEEHSSFIIQEEDDEN